MKLPCNSSDVQDSLAPEMDTESYGDNQSMSCVEVLASDSPYLDLQNDVIADVASPVSDASLPIDSTPPVHVRSVCHNLASSRWSCFAPRKANGRSDSDGGAHFAAEQHGGATDGQRLCSLLTAQEAKMEKIRAKNRRNQKAVRDRLRVLGHALTSVP